MPKKSKIKSDFHTNKPMFELLFKVTLLNINDLDSSLPSVVSFFFFYRSSSMYSPRMILVVCHQRRQKSFDGKWRNLLFHVLYMYYLYPKRMVHEGCVFIFVASTTVWLRFEDESFRGRRSDENQSSASNDD